MMSEDWTRDNVTPFFKKDSRRVPRNCRSVSVTSVPDKLVGCKIKKIEVVVTWINIS